MILKYFALILMLGLGVGAARADVAQTVNDRILPDLAGFRMAAQQLADKAATSCDPEILRPAWNAAFDAWLRQRDTRSGLRDFEAIVALAAEHGMELQLDQAMPANNRTLVFRKR